MANRQWLGTAAATPQVVTLTPGGTIEADDKFIATLTLEDGLTQIESVTAGGTTVAAVCTAIYTQLSASTKSEFQKITWADNTTNVIGTAKTAGVPFYIALSTTESGGGGADAQTFTLATTTANSGPNDWNTALNWSGGAVPVDSDSAFILSTNDSDILYGLDQSGIALTLLRTEEGHGQIGTLTAALRLDGCTKYEEGVARGDGSGGTTDVITNINFGASAVTGEIFSTANRGSSGKAPVQIKGTHANNAFTVRGSSIVGFGTAVAGESTTLLTLTVFDNAKAICGSGVTLGTLNPEGGSTTLSAAATTISFGSGAVTVTGSGNITTVNVGGSFTWSSSGVITTLNGYGSAIITLRAGTVTNALIYGRGVSVDADNGTPLGVTFTNGIDVLAGAKSSQVNFGDGVTVTPSAV